MKLNTQSLCAPGVALLVLLFGSLAGCGKDEAAQPAVVTEDSPNNDAPPREVPEEPKDQPKVDDSVKAVSVPAPAQNEPVDVPDPPRGE